MPESNWWFVAAAAFIGIELMTGTFYLLLYGIACALAGVAALLGAPVALQFLLATIIALGGTFWLRQHKLGQRRAAEPSLDIGEPVQVSVWQSAHKARVRYRGSDWDAELTVPLSTQPEVLYIVAQRGNTLIVAEKST